ncbi:universal stress protein [Paenibacillus sp. PR3]|uniref:Universal stress protein n=1 Tax=Paenibacillus terricola TaxID=2763503 RepID=A0ABR8MX39_9BACL|nr:universal stress protein [Paenibacillus terricola]MBD3920544.1 universal stress protein [Paenibacillus terricola]
MYNRIVVPIDGSPQAWKALDHAIDLAHAHSSVRLTALHVDASVSLNEPVFGTELDHAVAAEDKQVIDSAIRKLTSAGVNFQAMHQSGSPSEVICQTATQEQADLIVMGSRGLGLVKEMLLGSVSHAVAQHAICPVLLVK